MKGSVAYDKDREMWCVNWPMVDRATGRRSVLKLRKWKGEFLFRTHGNREKDRGFVNAGKLLARMRSDFEDGRFDLAKYKAEVITDVPAFLRDWLGAVSHTLAPATVKDYRNSVEKYLVPFFLENPYDLHEVTPAVLMKLLGSITRGGKGKRNVMYVLRVAMDYAARDGKIRAVPPFPRRRDYQIINPVVRWITEERQAKILNAIPVADRPIFLWLKYHFRRPGEACALYWQDYDREQNVFLVRRAFSNRVLVDRIKEGKIQVTPCMQGFLPVMESLCRVVGSPFLFVNPRGRRLGAPYQVYVLERIWKKACEQVGESIGLYAGTKHSRCSHYRNVLGYSMEDLQSCTGHADIRSVEKYTSTEIAHKRALMEGVVVDIRKRRVGE